MAFDRRLLFGFFLVPSLRCWGRQVPSFPRLSCFGLRQKLGLPSLFHHILTLLPPMINNVFSESKEGRKSGKKRTYPKIVTPKKNPGLKHQRNDKNYNNVTKSENA
jgi:hypothetical protein